MFLSTPITAKSALDGGRGVAWVNKPMAVTLILLVSFPLWAEAVGLYTYLGVEVVIWMIYALGFNLLLGYTGLPSFGHGAFFGVGAYAYGLCSRGLIDNPLVSLLCPCNRCGRAAGRPNRRRRR